MKDVILLEQSNITSGTTWHAAGLIGQLGSSATITKLRNYSLNLYKQLEDALKAISEEETRTARLYTIGKITDEVWDSLWQEWQDKRRSNQISLVSLYRQHKHV